MDISWRQLFPQTPEQSCTPMCGEATVSEKERITKKKSESFGEYEITGILQGSSSEALILLNQYREIVEGLSIFENRIDEIRVSPPHRNPELELFEFTIIITLKPG